MEDEIETQKKGYQAQNKAEEEVEQIIQTQRQRKKESFKERRKIMIKRDPIKGIGRGDHTKNQRIRW
eukprot:TRINITY_DN11869_c0_g1_i1.p1 TRINITY_DN11869_c0_g1~~TRINITY_DN11869_c0_g1_i1.p1  ORF type:complete len:67 (+),score=18.24 TRINITY_DN11869_c0_g1_i1:43-243(+)